jgi:dTDP-4-amino-4,6-dideoxygalactose transaminase
MAGWTPFRRRFSGQIETPGEWQCTRRANAARPDTRAPNPGSPAAADTLGRHVYHLYVVRIKQRDAILEAMTRLRISCGIHYPIPVHRQPAYRHLGHGEGSFPVAEQCAKEFLSLPMFPELTREQIETVSRELAGQVKGVTRGVTAPRTRQIRLRYFRTADLS